MTRLICSVVALSLGLLAMPAGVDAATTKKPAKAAAAKKAASAPPVELPPEVLTDAQIAEAGRVLTGHADCEFKQVVDVEPVADHPGHFAIEYGKLKFDMVPEITTTGAVRLHDRLADVVWLQIPVKSMMMDNKAGHRIVDACQEPEQRLAVEAIAQAQLAAKAAQAAATAANLAASAATSAAVAASAAVTAAEPPATPASGIPAISPATSPASGATN